MCRYAAGAWLLPVSVRVSGDDGEVHAVACNRSFWSRGTTSACLADSMERIRIGGHVILSAVWHVLQSVSYSSTLGGIVSQRSDGYHHRQPSSAEDPSSDLRGTPSYGYGLPQVRPPRRARRKSPRKGSIVIFAVILIAIIVTVALVESGRSHQETSLPPLREDLQLSGLVNGRFTTATAVQGMTSTFPGQQGGLGRVDATACVQNTGEGWEVDLYGQVGAHPMSLSFDGDDTSSNDMADTYVGTHAVDNRANSGGQVAFYWGSVDLGFPVPGSATLVVNRNGRSGTMNIQLTDRPFGGSNLETITGSWRCG